MSETKYLQDQLDKYASVVDKGGANFESRYNALLLYMTMFFFGLVAYAALGEW